VTGTRSRSSASGSKFNATSRGGVSKRSHYSSKPRGRTQGETKAGSTGSADGWNVVSSKTKPKRKDGFKAKAGSRSGSKPKTAGKRKRMLCKDHAAHKWGLSSTPCSKGAKKCGFAHDLCHQVVDADKHQVYTLIRNAVSSGDAEKLATLELTEEMIKHFQRMSKICSRFCSCLKKMEDGSLQKKDLCTGGLNCTGGICGDSPDYDFSTSLLLDPRDWQYGTPAGYGIQLTRYGLVPLNVQRQRAAAAAAAEEERQRELNVRRMMTDAEAFPSLGGGTSACCAGETKASSWGKPRGKPNDSKEATAECAGETKASSWGKPKDWNATATKVHEIEEQRLAERKKQLALERKQAAAAATAAAYERPEYDSDSFSDWDKDEYDEDEFDDYSHQMRDDDYLSENEDADWEDYW